MIVNVSLSRRPTNCLNLTLIKFKKKITILLYSSFLSLILQNFNFLVKDKHFVEITMCYHAIHNLEEIKKRSEEIIDIQKELRSSIYVLNYRFIREYTEGVKDAWTINAINHLKAEEHDNTIL